MEKQPDNFDARQTHHSWSQPILDGYRASKEEHVWLAPATWLAVFSLTFTIGSALYFWGKSSSQKVTQAQLRDAVRNIPTRQEVTQQIKGKASREDMLILQSNVDLIKLDLGHLKTTQTQGFKRITEGLDRLLHVKPELRRDSSNLRRTKQ